MTAISLPYRADFTGALKTLADIDWHTGRRQAACSIYVRAQRVLRAADELPPSDQAIKLAVDRAVGECQRR